MDSIDERGQGRTISLHWAYALLLSCATVSGGHAYAATASSTESAAAEPPGATADIEPRDEAAAGAQSEGAPVADSEASAEALPDVASDLTASSTDDDYDFLSQQILRGEAITAVAELDTIVAQLEAIRHRYHEDLIRPLTLRGDALMVQEDYAGALDNYARARHIARTANGLFDPSQIDIVYREADAHARLGELDEAVQREEYAYEVVRRAYEEYDMRLIPALHRLARFYMKTYNYLAARSLYRRAMSVYEANGAGYSIDAIASLQGIARSHRLERFPPIYVHNPDENRLEGPQPGLTTSDLDSQHITFNNFPAGEKALQRVVEIRRSQDPEDVAATLDAILELADWHMMFGRNNAANTLYSYIYEQMVAAGEDAVTFFGAPTLLYLPRPHDPERSRLGPVGPRTAGVVSVQFDVTATGRVRKLKTIDSQPPKLMDFRVRRSMRLAQFRPQLVDGVPVHTDMQTYTHDYHYYPTPEQQADAVDRTTREVNTEPGADADEALTDEAPSDIETPSDGTLEGPAG